MSKKVDALQAFKALRPSTIDDARKLVTQLLIKGNFYHLHYDALGIANALFIKSGDGYRLDEKLDWETFESIIELFHRG